MGLTPEDVDEILRYLEHSAFDELELETPEFKLVVRRGQGAGGSNNVPAEPLSAGNQATDTAPPPSAGTTEPTSQDVRTDEEKQPPAAAASDGQIAIPAPLRGIFYRAPRPGADPFVDVGTQVQEDTVVCIIEVMKLMHSITAGVKGTITAVCAENGEAVEKGQPLFMVRPERASDA
ncbi:acetyl-CoA carboxylase biotin carboxyl carrier protein [Sphaerobacter thermophilus]|uniref:Biotin carboxyl carrier protein of acetyl-CoA carboxylase n=1 Tax=Sphaerobacter thermophilus (strain ATCC 49802 / DSM 20745 / KCCM 41009 / NCIMB 13125 / S 6022) TaxID=479434 RepID=D1C8U0_SPHTD|nr:biotin/lipoyl-containing protein [Sphaerobacter thermophilus]ACZ40233.1 acetyl-CoA carboxylase, biotin carboxyl carrier protein [Sphaerobacter thermophilus DSM 20745]